jgi:hypothetical protein
MARFAWAYINCSGSSTGSADGAPSGPSGSLQFMTASGAGNSTGSVNLTYLTGRDTLYLTGTLVVSGTIEANNYDVITTNKIEIDVSGNTNFGNDNADTHIFTGSLSVMSSSTYILSTSVGLETTFVRGFGGNYTAVTTTPYSVQNSDYILGVQIANYVTMSVPSAVGKTGKVILIKDEFYPRGTGSIVITGAVAGVTFDGSNNYILTGSNPAISLYSNGTNWFVF